MTNNEYTTRLAGLKESHNMYRPMAHELARAADRARELDQEEAREALRIHGINLSR